MFLRSKAYSFKCGDDFETKVKSLSKWQSKHFTFEEHKKCLDGEDYQRECTNYILKSFDHEMHLQKLKKYIHYLFSMITGII